MGKDGRDGAGGDGSRKKGRDNRMRVKVGSGIYSAAYQIPCFSRPYAGFRAGGSARAGAATHGARLPFLRSVKLVLDSVFAALAAVFGGITGQAGCLARV